MWAALYGRFEEFPRPTPRDVMEVDAYRLFVARSAEMGWLTDPADGGLWGMNDAGSGSSGEDLAEPVGWFQVVLTQPSIAYTLLPIQPFLNCAADVMHRLGEFEMQSVQLLLPESRSARPDDKPDKSLAVDRLADTAGWFANCDPKLRTNIKASLQTRGPRSLRSLVARLSEPPLAPWQSTVRWGAPSFDDGQTRPVPDSVAHELRPLNEPLRSVLLEGELVEWSVDSVAWAAASLGSAAHGDGYTSPILLTVSKH